MSKPEACKKPPLLGKAKMEDYIITKSDEGVISFTAIQVNMIFDYSLPKSIFIPLNSDKVRNRLLLIQSTVIIQNQIPGYVRDTNPAKS
jgi:hypothetical protein